MIPILYSPSSVVAPVVPTSFGIGSLTDCISCSCVEERNGKYELEFVYPANGIHADQIQYGSVIKAKPNFSDNPQLFRVYKISKTMGGQFTVYCQAIAYDLSGKIITTGTAGSCTAACLLLTGSAGGFNITTDKTVTADFEITEPSSVRSWFGGKKGSLLDVYGTAEWHYDNFSCELLLHRGQDRGVEIRYGKNLTELSQEISMDNLCTGIVPFCIDDDGNKTVGTRVATGLVLDFDRDRAVDFSDDVDFESATPLATQLATLTSNYIANNNFTDVFNSITLDFVQLSNLTERVDLCDTVHIYFDALGITASLKCVATTWDVLNERYISCTFGDMRTSIADTIVNQQKEVADKPSVSEMGKAIDTATKLITGNLGGYVVMHDSDLDGEPDEILIMDTDDITTATNVIRMNQAGIGLSTTGYVGPYTTALTASGIVADAITAGVLNANLIKAGVIEDVAHNSQIDMTTGVAKLWSLIATGDFTVKDDNTGDELAKIYRTVNGTSLLIRNRNIDTVITAQVGANDEGLFSVRNGSGYETVLIDGENGHIEQTGGCVQLWSGESYTGSIDIIGAYDKYTSYLIYGRVDSGGSFISTMIPRTMITDTNQKFIITDDDHYVTFNVRYIGSDLRIDHNTKDAMGCLLKVYGIY